MMGLKDTSQYYKERNFDEDEYKMMSIQNFRQQEMDLKLIFEVEKSTKRRRWQS